MKLTTPRISIRPPEKADFSLLRQLDTDAEGLKYVNGGHEKSLEESTDSFNRMLELYRQYGMGFHVWETINEGEFIGWGGFKFIENTERIEIGYRIRKKFWGKGYTTEATKKLMHYAQHELGLKEIYGRVNPENKASIRIIENLGMKMIETSTFKGVPVYVYKL